MAKQIDNHNVSAKLALRRYFLEKYHDEPPDVLDCCQGGGLLWRELRKTIEVSSYWGLDLKPKKGRLKLDSVRVLQQHGWPQNVIDIDTYGSPWKHWMALLPNADKPITCFLTIGNQNSTSMNTNAHGGQFANVFPPSTPDVIAGKILRQFDVSWLLAKSCEHGKIIVEAVEAENDGNARYIGVHLRPQETATPELCVPAKSKPTRSVKETEHV